LGKGEIPQKWLILILIFAIMIKVMYKFPSITVLKLEFEIFHVLSNFPLDSHHLVHQCSICLYQPPTDTQKTHGIHYPHFENFVLNQAGLASSVLKLEKNKNG
jgi:hypothetical protein